MEFLDNVIEKAIGVYDVAAKKTGEVVEISKLKMECVKLNTEIKRLYEQMGSSVYSMVKNKFENLDLINSLSQEIDEKIAILKALNDRINETKNTFCCQTCGSKNVEENYYCSKCGSRMKSEFTGYDDISEMRVDDIDILTEDEAQV